MNTIIRQDTINSSEYKKLREKLTKEQRRKLKEMGVKPLLQPFFVACYSNDLHSGKTSKLHLTDARHEQRHLILRYTIWALIQEHKCWLRMAKTSIGKNKGDRAYCLHEATKTRKVLQNLKYCIQFLKV